MGYIYNIPGQILVLFGRFVLPEMALYQIYS